MTNAFCILPSGEYRLLTYSPF